MHIFKESQTFRSDRIPVSLLKNQMNLWRGLTVIALSHAILGCAGRDPLLKLRMLAFEAVHEQAETVKIFLAGGRSEHDVLVRATEVASSMLKDPESARFRNLRLVPHGDSKVVCGEINGKNSYGGYVGFSRFVGGAVSAYLEDTDASTPAVQAAANAGLNFACETIPSKSITNKSGTLPIQQSDNSRNLQNNDASEDIDRELASRIAVEESCPANAAVTLNGANKDQRFYNLWCGARLLKITCGPASCRALTQ